MDKDMITDMWKTENGKAPRAEMREAAEISEKAEQRWSQPETSKRKTKAPQPQPPPSTVNAAQHHTEHT